MQGHFTRSGSTTSTGRNARPGPSPCPPPPPPGGRTIPTSATATADRDPQEAYYLEREIRHAGEPEPIAYFRFLTSLKPDADHIEELVRCRRTRWQIKNETCNRLKNQGYHVEHHFGHGQNGRSNVLLALNLITFHNAYDPVCEHWQRARNRFGRRIRFFLTLDTLTAWQFFNRWHSLLTQIVCPHLRNAQGP